MKIDKRIIDHLKLYGYSDAAKFLQKNPPKVDLSKYRLIVGNERSINSYFDRYYFEFYFGGKVGKNAIEDFHDEKVTEILENIFEGDDISIHDAENQHSIRIPEGGDWKTVKNYLINKLKPLGADVVEEEFN